MVNDDRSARALVVFFVAVEDENAGWREAIDFFDTE